MEGRMGIVVNMAKSISWFLFCDMYGSWNSISGSAFWRDLFHG